MILRYRVSLAGIKGFARVYEVKSSMTLYEFHKIMRDDMGFPHDQPILFKGFNISEGLVARYGMFDLGFGTADRITLGETLDKEIATFTYFYNVTDRKSVIVTCEGETDALPGRSYPMLVETKGPDPEAFENGYIAYEDLPDEQKHLPGENPGWGKDSQGADSSEEDDDLDLSLDLDEEDDDDEDENDIMSGNDEEDIIFDGTEELTL